MNAGTVRIAAQGREFEIEYAWVGPGEDAGATSSAATPAIAPVIVFLHEGLGSLSMWRDFPSRLCEAVGRRGLVYSRAGYGRSTPRPLDQPLRPDYMHRQALEDLPALLDALGVAAPYLLFGHSDGGSIALIHAASYPRRVAGVIALAPHVFVEDRSVQGIAEVRRAWLETDRFARLARHHRDVESVFWGWNDIWLSPAFRDWNIEALLPAIRCPILAIQGDDDEFGTMAQIDAIAAATPATDLVELAACRHSPHKDQPEAVIAAAREFVEGLTAGRTTPASTDTTEETGS